LLDFTVTYCGLGQGNALSGAGVALHGPVAARTPVNGTQPVPDTTLTAGRQVTFGNVASGTRLQFNANEDAASEIPNLPAGTGLTVKDDILLGFWYVDLHT
jgi:hypothetical protein